MLDHGILVRSIQSAHLQREESVVDTGLFFFKYYNKTGPARISQTSEPCVMRIWAHFLPCGKHLAAKNVLIGALIWIRGSTLNKEASWVGGNEGFITKVVGMGVSRISEWTPSRQLWCDKCPSRAEILIEGYATCSHHVRVEDTPEFIIVAKFTLNWLLISGLRRHRLLRLNQCSI